MERETRFDGKKALIIGDHPHSGATCICLGADNTSVGWGMKFNNPNSGEEFYVFIPHHIMWVDNQLTPHPNENRGKINARKIL